MAFMPLKPLTWAKCLAIYGGCYIHVEKCNRKSTFFTLLNVATYSWHLSMCNFLGPFLCFWIQMVVPKGALSLLIKWEAKKKVSFCLKIYLEGSPAVVKGLQRLTSQHAVGLFLMKIFNGLWSLFFENLVLCLSIWQVCIWAWNLARCWHGRSISWDLFG